MNELLQKSVIYELNCSDCNTVYIGQSLRGPIQKICLRQNLTPKSDEQTFVMIY